MDSIRHYTLFDGQARALVGITTDLCREAQRIHNMTPLTAAALGRSLTATLFLASTLKGEDTLSATIRGDGPIGTIVCAADANCHVRGYVDVPDLTLPDKRPGKLDVGSAVGNQGRLTVVKDLGLKEPYVGQTELISGEIAEDFAYYLTLSEQQPSLLALGVRFEKGEVVAAGGVLLQALPGCGEEALRAMEGTGPMLTDISTLAFDAENVETLSEWVLVGMPKQFLKADAPEYCCTCSRERLEKVLISLGSEELNDMIEKQNGAQLTCHFCEKVYDFSGEDLKSLLQEAQS